MKTQAVFRCILCSETAHVVRYDFDVAGIFRCQGCGMMALHPQPTAADLGTVYGEGYFFNEQFFGGRGPAESTLSIVLLMYEEGFRWWNLGYATAIAFVLFGIIVAVTAAQLGFRHVVRTREAT